MLAAARGWKVGEIVVHHRPRKFGHTKYGLRRFVKGLLDLFTVYFLTGFGQRPAHLLGTVGLISFLLGALGVLILTAAWVLTRTSVWSGDPLELHKRAVFYYSMVALLLGAQFASISFLAELLTAYHIRETKSYSIRERAGSPGRHEPGPPTLP